MARAMDETKQWFYIFEKILECPVCMDVPQCNIFLCETGHHICKFCKDKVPDCPFCHARILGTRNFLAEGVTNKLEEMQLFIENEIQNIKLDSEKESTSTCTQTDNKFEVPKSKSSSATQTVEMARANVENRKAKGTAPSALSLPCQIGSCMFKSSYRGLLQHLAEYHRDTFYEVHECRGQFTETCVISTNALPQSYDFAFLKSGTDIFFFNMVFQRNGFLQARVLLVKKAEIANLYHYDLTIKNGAHQLTQHGKVAPCNGSTAMAYSNIVWLHNEQLFRNTMARSSEVTITIRRCVCKQFRENVAAVNA